MVVAKKLIAKVGNVQRAKQLLEAMAG